MSMRRKVGNSTSVSSTLPGCPKGKVKRKSGRLIVQTIMRPHCSLGEIPRMTSQMLVDAANRQTDHMANLTPFRTFQQNGLNLRIECHRVTELPAKFISWALTLTRENMHDMYEKSEWGWRDKSKYEELSNIKAWYLIARTMGGHSVGFVHFRFDLDYGVEVLYCYEIQLLASVQRYGLGKYLMLILELLAMNTKMKKVVLTVFKHNVAGRKFFAKTLRYEVDETSPTSRRATYEVLSKKVFPKNEPFPSHSRPRIYIQPMNSLSPATVVKSNTLQSESNNMQSDSNSHDVATKKDPDKPKTCDDYSLVSRNVSEVDSKVLATTPKKSKLSPPPPQTDDIVPQGSQVK